MYSILEYHINPVFAILFCAIHPPTYAIAKKWGLSAHFGKANKKPCPLGNGSSHFSSVGEANKYLERKHADNIDATKSTSSLGKDTKYSPPPNTMKAKIKNLCRKIA